MTPSVAPWSVPASWFWGQFQDAAEIAQDLVDPALVPDMPHIAPNNIGSGNRQLLPFKTVKQDGVFSPKQRFKPGQILFTKIRPYLLKSIKIDFDGVCSADMYPLWTKITVDRDYLLYWLTSVEFRNIISHRQGRSVLPKINQIDLNATPLPLPPIQEQRRIVAKVGSLSARSERARDHLDRVPVLVDKYRRAVLAEVFGVRWSDGGFIHTFPCRELGSIADIQSGITLGKQRTPGQKLISRPYLRVANVQRGWLALNDVKSVSVTEEEAKKLLLFPGDILMNEGGDRDKLGRGWVWSGEIQDCIHQNHVFRVRLKDQSFPARLISYFANEFGQHHFFSEGTQTTNLASISKSKLSTLMVPYPTTEEAVRVLQRIETAFAWIDRLAGEASDARRLIDHLDQALLAKAFRGELVPQDPNDEPASVLLERIKAEKAGSPATGRRRGRPRAATLL